MSFFRSFKPKGNTPQLNARLNAIRQEGEIKQLKGQINNLNNQVNSIKWRISQLRCGGLK